MDGTRIMDLGTGGGFPGIPLAIAFPRCHFVLVDSRNKKLKVIRDIVKKTGLKNVITAHERAEFIQSKFHFVTCRAVASLDKLVLWSERLLSPEQFNSVPNGLISLKGGDFRGELKSIPSHLKAEVRSLILYFNHTYYEEKYLIYIPL